MGVEAIEWESNSTPMLHKKDGRGGAVPSIETDRISGEKTPHYCGNRHIGGFQE
jgi:hypothetical protein